MLSFHTAFNKSLGLEIISILERAITASGLGKTNFLEKKNPVLQDFINFRQE